MQKIDIRYTKISAAEDVTDEVKAIALEIADGWYQTGRIDWADLIDRIEGNELDDGSMIDFGDGLNDDRTDTSDAIKRLKTIIREHRRNS